MLHNFNARVIAATSHDLGRSVGENRFREDLFYHLNVVPLHVPPLREHREDISDLLGYYADLLASQKNLPYRRFTVGGQNRLRNYSWPGNIRELENIVQRLLILGSGPKIDLGEIDLALEETPRQASRRDLQGFDLKLKEAREQYERAYFEHHIRAARGNLSKVAKQAGVDRTHLYRKLRTLGIDPRGVGLLDILQD